MKKLVKEIKYFIIGTSIFWLPIIGSFIASNIANLLLKFLGE